MKMGIPLNDMPRHVASMLTAQDQSGSHYYFASTLQNFHTCKLRGHIAEEQVEIPESLCYEEARSAGHHP